ncbi:MAG: SUMF1/EgtB/PvdO family nonheme iron enzyme [Sedimenticola sp.]
MALKKGDNRVLRGGSWNNNGRNLRSAYRNRNRPGNRNHTTGFRLARARSAPDGAFLTRVLSRPRGCYSWQKPIGRRCVSRVSGCRLKACRLTALQ